MADIAGSIRIEPIEPRNMEELLEVLREEQETFYEIEGFVTLNEPELIDNFTYEQMRHDKYGYAVTGLKDE